MSEVDLARNEVSEGDLRTEAFGESLGQQQPAPDDDARLGDDLTWSQIRAGWKDYKERAASAIAAAKAVGRAD